MYYTYTVICSHGPGGSVFKGFHRFTKVGLKMITRVELFLYPYLPGHACLMYTARPVSTRGQTWVSLCQLEVKLSHLRSPGVLLTLLGCLCDSSCDHLPKSLRISIVNLSDIRTMYLINFGNIVNLYNQSQGILSVGIKGFSVWASGHVF